MCMKREREKDGEICENGTFYCAFPIMKHFLFPFLFYYCVDMSSCCVFVYSRKAGNADDDDDDVSFCKLMQAEEMKK